MGILEHPSYRAPLMGLFPYLGMWTGACLIRRIVRGRMGALRNGGPAGWLVVTTAALTGAISGYLFLPFSKILIPAGAVAGQTYSKCQVMTFGAPAAVLIMLIAGVLHIGLMGRQMSDARREWTFTSVVVWALSVPSSAASRVLPGKTRRSFP